MCPSKPVPPSPDFSLIIICPFPFSFYYPHKDSLIFHLVVNELESMSTEKVDRE